MNNFMPSNLTSALYNQVNQNKGEQYSYDINLSTVNKSLNEYNMGQALFVDGEARRQKLEAVIIEADEESYYQNDSPVRGVGGPVANRRMTQGAPDSRSGYSNSPPPTNKNPSMIVPSSSLHPNAGSNLYKNTNNNLKESSAFHKLNQKMKQKRNNAVTNNNRDNSNDPYETAA